MKVSYLSENRLLIQVRKVIQARMRRRQRGREFDLLLTTTTILTLFGLTRVRLGREEFHSGQRRDPNCEVEENGRIQNQSC